MTSGSDLAFEFDDLDAAVRTVWDGNAAYWDGHMGDGNRWHRELIAPHQERLLALDDGEAVLDVACGNGNFARRMAELGADVVAFDISERMIERATARGHRGPGSIEYHVIDASDEEAVRALGHHRFDAVVCTMAIMDMPKVSPMLSGVAHVLRAGGRFVFSIQHPCFNSSATRFVLEESERDGIVTRRYSLQISEYIESRRSMGLALVGQPHPQHYFHRPIGALFGACFEAGFVLDGMAEPTFQPSDPADREANPIVWSNHPAIPPALIARLRRMPP